MMNNNQTDDEIRKKIEECCKRMRISSGLAQRAMELGDRQCHLYLLDLLKEECLLRRNRKTQKNATCAGFPKNYSWEEFDSSGIQFHNGVTFEHLRSLEFHEDRENVVMYGNTGTGKTMLSIILGLSLIKKGETVRYFRTPNLIDRLGEEKDRGTLNNFYASFKRVSVVIIDEFGYIPYDLKGVRLFFDFVSEIYTTKSIILTTNLEFTNWGKVIPDEKLAAPLVGRITENATILRFTGKDRRRMSSNKA